MSKLPFTIYLIFFLTMFVSPVSGYDYSGTINENGDDRWDENEINFIDFELDAGETIDLQFSSIGELEVMLCKCDSSSDIEDYLEELYLDETIPDDLYLWIDSYSFTEDSFTADSRMDLTAAIFTYNPSNPSSMSYTLTSNIPEGDRLATDIDTTTIFIVLAIIAAVVYLYRKQNNQNRENTQDPYNYQQSASPYQPITYQNDPHQSDTSMEESRSTRFCPNCGKANTSAFCTECGTKVE